FRTYFGCTVGSPPGEPGGGMILISPPCSGGTLISGSIPAGGQITPLESASLSLRLGLGFPIVGAFPRTSGGHMPARSGSGVIGAFCASATAMLLRRTLTIAELSLCKEQHICEGNALGCTSFHSWKGKDRHSWTLTSRMQQLVAPSRELG